MDVEDTSSSSDEERESSMPIFRKIALTFGVLTIGMVFSIAIFAIYPSLTSSGSQDGKSATGKIEQTLRKQAEAVVEPPMTIAKFVTTRRLAEVAAPAFDAKCPVFQPQCDLVGHFKSQLQKEFKTLSEHDALLAKHLYNTTVTPAEQRLILDILPLAHNKSVIGLGQLIAQTVKRWASKGEKVVHEKVRETLIQYSKDKGIELDLPASASRPGAWTPLMHPKVLALIGGDSASEPVAPVVSRGAFPEMRRLFTDPLTRESRFSVAAITSVFGAGALLRLTLFIFQILHKTKVVALPLWMRATIMWGNLAGGAITCIATILIWCPILFLQYWFNAWLLFSNKPRELDDWHVAPFGAWMRDHLPGFRGRRLLAVDPRMAA
jgi:hypothetical protein